LTMTFCLGLTYHLIPGIIKLLLRLLLKEYYP